MNNKWGEERDLIYVLAQLDRDTVSCVFYRLLGANRSEIAEYTGLTFNQVRYKLRSFWLVRGKLQKDDDLADLIQRYCCK